MEKLDEFVATELKVVEDSVTRVVHLRANMVFCKGTIDIATRYCSAENGIFAVQDIDRSNIFKLANGTSAMPFLDIDGATENDLDQTS